MKIKREQYFSIIIIIALLIISISAASASDMIDNGSTLNIASDTDFIESDCLSDSTGDLSESFSISPSDEIKSENIALNDTDHTANSEDIISYSGYLGEVNSNNNENILQDTYLPDVYFNASAREDGDGSIDNPYQDLKNHQITGRTAYFADGIYTLTKTSNTIGADTILIGESSTGTIINCSNFGFRVFSALKLINLTITDIGINVTGNLSAEGVIFENCIRVNVTSTSATDTVSAGYNNTYGGSIYSYRASNSYTGTSGDKPVLEINNCTFINSNAVYGGSIYMNDSVASIENSKFINSSSYIYGGAIAAIGDSDINITGTLFDNCISIDDAGAGIYSRNASLRVIDSNFTNCNATFGSAITQLEKRLYVSGSSFENNIARFEGGAIYDMYASCEIYASTFVNNSAINGGAIFIDNATGFSITLSDFVKNNAIGIGGAVFLNAIGYFTNTDNLFSKNIAANYSDIYEQDSWGIFYGSEAKVIYNNNLTWDEEIPSSYDLRDYGWVSSVKDQMAGGSCWAFAAMAAAESAILKATNETYDFSEENMKNLAVIFSKYGMESWYGRYALYPNEGGNNYMAIGYLVSWMGLINETLDKYDDISDLSYVFNESEIHIQNVYYVPPRQNYTDNDYVKMAILKYGAVSTGIYYSSAYLSNKINYYFYGSSAMYGANHAVTIVGWDDNYSASNFAGSPGGDGAFIVKNSWGSDWGEDGFFYVSYYDTIFTQVGEQDAFAIVFSDNTSYNRNYQYDVGGMTDWFITGENTIWYKNTFTSVANDYLTAFSTYFNASLTNYTAFIYVNDELKDTVEGSTEMGYYTIKLNDLIPIYVGDNFTISIKIQADELASFPVIEYSTYRLTDYPNVSFFSYDGENWIDLYDYELNMTYYKHYYNGQLACIKAFTTRPIEMFDTEITIESIADTTQRNIQITAMIKDNESLNVVDGKVNFEINGVNYTADVNDGVAIINYTFADEGTYIINAYYYGGISYIESKTSINAEIVKIATSITINNQGKSKIQNNNPINFTVLDAEGNIVKSGTLTVDINGVVSTYELIGEPIMCNLYVNDISTISIMAYYADGKSYANSENSANYEFTSFKTNPTVEFDGKTLIIHLLDEFGNKSTGTLSMNLNLLDNDGNTLKSQTLELEEGEGIFEYPFEPSNYTLELKFNGTDKYEASNFIKTYDIKPLTFIDLTAKDNYVLSSENIKVKVLDWNGNPLKEGAVIFYIYNGDELIYTIQKTINNGLSEDEFIFNKTGNYTIKVIFENNNYIFSEKSSIIEISRIPTVIRASAPSVKPGENIHISLGINPSKADGLITVLVNGIEYGAGLYNGEALIGISGLAIGNYIGEIRYEGSDNYENSSLIIPIYVNKYPQYEIKASDISMVYKGGKYLTVSAYYFGKLVKNEKIQISRGKSTYYIQIDSKGQAKYKVNLNPGTYYFTVKYQNASKQVKVTVKKAKLHFAKVSKTVKVGKYFKLRVLDGNNKAVKAVKVKIKIGKKTYKVKTNKKGYAMLKLTKKRVKIGKVSVKYSLYSNKYYYAGSKTIKVKVKK